MNTIALVVLKEKNMRTSNNYKFTSTTSTLGELLLMPLILMKELKINLH
jgi:hypothetical protein